MGRIPMSTGWVVIPEGEYVFGIYNVEHDVNFGKVTVKLVTADGKTHEERFSILQSDGTYNDGALGALSNLAKNALNDFDAEDFDTDELKGRYVAATVYHTQVESKKYPGKMSTYAHLRDYAPANGFLQKPSQKVENLMGGYSTAVRPEELPFEETKKPFDMFAGLSDILNS